MIFVSDKTQRAAAETSRESAEQRTGPVMTTIEDAPTFWPAEDYHQHYLEKRGLASCHVSLPS